MPFLEAPHPAGRPLGSPLLRLARRTTKAGPPHYCDWAAAAHRVSA
jgi:hypothetical protein